MARRLFPQSARNYWFFLLLLLLLTESQSVRHKQQQQQQQQPPSHSLCRATSSRCRHLKDIKFAFHSYPLDTYDEAFSSSHYNYTAAYNCSAIDTFQGTGFHECSVNDCSLCPVQEQNLVAFELSRHWDVRASACHIRHTLASKKQPLSVIVLGGSVAWGHYSEGCMCDSSVDTKCTVFKQIGHFKKHRHNVHKHCRWSSYVQTFLQDMLPGKTSSVTNLAKRSFSSAMYANVIQQKLFQEDIELNSSTIIFLDFSINDDPDISEGLGLEKLVRLIYTLAGDSPPMIVLLDMRAGHHQLAYKDVAEHYGIHLWSLGDVVQAANATGQQQEVMTYLNFSKNKRMKNTNHPPWHVHQFYADLISELLARTIQRVLSRGYCAIPERSPLLPKQLLGQEDKSCLTSQLTDKLLLLTFTELPNPLLLLPAPGDSRSTWVFSDDGRVDKYGLISTFDRSDNHSSTEMVHTIDFPLNFSKVPELLPRKPHSEDTGMVSVAVTILYQRTYKDAGMFSVSVCGESVLALCELDALWHEPFSMPVSARAEVAVNMTACAASSTSPGRPVLQLKHEYVEASADPKRIHARMPHQKVKVLMIEGCLLEEAKAEEVVGKEKEGGETA